MTDAIVTFKPTAEQLNEVKDWLLIEDQKKRFAGFYCNWNSIEYSFERNEIVVILLDNKPIGFMTWWLSEKVVKMQIAEIKPGFRKKGYGRLLMEAVLAYLAKSGSMVAYLHCQPQSSEKAWRKIGFERYPSVPHFEHYNDKEEGRHLYRILVPHAKPENNPASNESVNLWAVERYQADRVSPKWKWALIFESGKRKLVTPIIAPVSHKWNINWTVGDKVIKSEEIKYFTRESLDFSGFLIIEEMPLPVLNK